MAKTENKKSRAKTQALTGQELRQFRSKYAKLKRAGLATGDARKVKPTKKNIALVARYANVITGEERAFKVRKKDRAALKEAGVHLRQNRAVVSRDYLVRNGKVFRPGKQGRVYTLRGDDIPRAVHAAWARLKPQHGMAFSLNGDLSYRMYPTPASLINELNKGVSGFDRTGKRGLGQITFFAPDFTQRQYQDLRSDERMAALEVYRQRARERARERAARSKKGVRKGRGR